LSKLFSLLMYNGHDSCSGVRVRCDERRNEYKGICYLMAKLKERVRGYVGCRCKRFVFYS